MNYKSVTLGVLCAGLCLATNAQAQSSFEFDNIDTLLTDNLLDEAASRYASVLLSFQPEQATRLGFASANESLTSRTPRQSAQMLTVLRSVKESLEQIDPKQLSQAKQIDRELLLGAVNDAIWQEEQNRFQRDPLYYTQALDAIYDLIAKPAESAVRQRLDLTARLNQLTQVAQQAEENLSNVAPYLAQLAMEKAYYAYLSADEWETALQPDPNDQDAVNQAKRTVFNAKQAVKKMFDLFKQLSQKESTQDFRLGQDSYFTVLKNRYQWSGKKTALFIKELEQTVAASQTELTQALEPFLAQEEASEVTVVDGEDAQQTAPAKPAKPTKKKKSKKLELRNAQDFYAAAKPFLTAEQDENLLQTLASQAQSAQELLTQQGALPTQIADFRISPLPQYYAYTLAYLFVPPFGNQLTPRSDFLVRIPSGNATAQQEQWNQDFNAPARKLMISGELVPGRYYQTQNTLKNSKVRRLYPSASMQNGWAAYAKRLAKEKGYITLDEELLFLAWDEYIHALAAFVDAKLQTRQYSYADALSFLTQTHGLNEEQAEQMLKQVSADPGKAVSYFIGLDALENAHRTFSKKYGKKFNEADFNAKLFQAGNVPPSLLDKELKRLYKRDAEMKKAKAL